MRRGFTLIEVMIAVIIAFTALAAFLSATGRYAKMYEKILDRQRLQRIASLALALPLTKRPAKPLDTRALLLPFGVEGRDDLLDYLKKSPLRVAVLSLRTIDPMMEVGGSDEKREEQTAADEEEGPAAAFVVELYAVDVLSQEGSIRWYRLALPGEENP